MAHTHTPRKAHFAILDDAHGILFRHRDGRIMFLDEATDQITVIGPEHMNFLVTLGEMGLANFQRLDDLANGGSAAIACARQQEVA